MDASLLLTVSLPLLMSAAGLVLCIVPTISLIRARRLAARGPRTSGEVITPHRQDGNRTSRFLEVQLRTSMAETIEYTVPTGETLRGIPTASDIGTVDRTGETVTVIHDPDRPEIFVAPLNGTRISPWHTGGGLVAGVAVVVVGVVLAVFFARPF